MSVQFIGVFAFSRWALLKRVQRIFSGLSNHIGNSKTEQSALVEHGLHDGERRWRWPSPSAVYLQWAPMAFSRDLRDLMHINEIGVNVTPWQGTHTYFT